MRITKFQVRDWWMRLHVALSSPSGTVYADGWKVIEKVLGEMKAASDSPFPTRANRGQTV